MPEIKFKQRAFYIGFQNEKPIASAVVKKGLDSKFCHLHIEEEHRHQNIGDTFFLLMSVYVKRYAKKVHFSLPEGLWEEKKKFFQSFGFEQIEKYQTQYRNSEEELTSSVDFALLWQRSLLKLPELIEQFSSHHDSPLNGIVMSIQPAYTNQILTGKKEVEIRKRFNKEWKKPEIIWSCYFDKLGCTKSEFDDYTKGEDKVFAILLCDVDSYCNSLPLNYLSSFMEKKIHPPQLYNSVIDTDWKSVISIAELLQGRFNVFSQL